MPPRFLILAVFALNPLVMAGAQSAPPSLGDGRAIYHAACANCHAANGKGAPAYQVGFDYPLPDFTDCSYASREAGQDWFAIVHEGGPLRGFSHRMPAFGSALTAAEIERVVAYVRSFCEDDSWPRGELNLPRAVFSEKAFPEDESVVTGYIDPKNGGSMRFDYVHEKRFGARNQFELRLPIIFRNRPDATTRWTGGHVGDISLSVKRAVYHTQSLTSASILSVGGELNLPTGDATGGFGAGTPVVEPFVLGARMLGSDAFVQFHGGVEIPTHQQRAPNESFFRAVVGRTFVPSGFGRAWTPMLEVMHVKEWQRGAPHEFDAVPQIQVGLNKRQHILASIGVRQPLTQRADRRRSFVFYLLWDWFDGGLRDGW